MRVDNPTKEQLKQYRERLLNRIRENNLVETRYLDLGTKTVRLLNYSKEFTPLIEKQLTYVLRDKAEKFDATIVLWKEEDIGHLYKVIEPKFDPKTNFKLRIDFLYRKNDEESLQVFDGGVSNAVPVLNVDIWCRIVNFTYVEDNTYFYGVENLEPEEFIKQGHIFVQILNKILKTETSNLVHGAAIGLNNKGVLLCARGQRGKSTLSVLSMIKGFEYVSDDYLTLEKTEEGLFSYPIYSIITLSPRMYNELYDEIKGSTFVSNNARKDKYVFNIANFHDRFKTKYPVEFCMFPEIVPDTEPSIVPCPAEEKGRAICQLIHSTLMQMGDLADTKTVKKLINMVSGFKFYKINLCSDILKNTECLRNFMENYNYGEKLSDSLPLEKICTDITFNLANIINSENGAIYCMNKFATNIYENLLRGVIPDDISDAVHNKGIEGFEDDFKTFLQILYDKELLNNVSYTGQKADINFGFAEDEDFKLFIEEHYNDEHIELIKQYKEDKDGMLCAK